MAEKDKATRVSKAESNDNPLISNQKLKQIYQAMIQARLFDEHLMTLQRRIKPAGRLPSTFGQEACRVSTLIELKAGDLISDVVNNPVTDLVLGIAVRPLLQETLTRLRSTNTPRSTIQKDNIAQQMPPIANARDRVQIAMGSALALKTLKRGNVVVAYVYRREVGAGTWKKILTLARKLELPIIFVVQPTTESKKRGSAMMVACDKARAAGVPGIPVDSGDAVALFRVIQESLGRTRGGDGPVVIECLSYKLTNHATALSDPIIQMKRFLLERKVCGQPWLDFANKSFRKKLSPWKH
jgi:TPP-dependent pyruvate/acetoin dehydrogenase alpha subunit